MLIQLACSAFQIQYKAPEVRDTDVLRIAAKITSFSLYPGCHEVYILNSAAHDANNMIMIYDGYGRPINPCISRK